MSTVLSWVTFGINIANSATKRAATGTNLLRIAKKRALIAVELGAVRVVLAAHCAHAESGASIGTGAKQTIHVGFAA